MTTTKNTCYTIYKDTRMDIAYPDSSYILYDDSTTLLQVTFIDNVKRVLINPHWTNPFYLEFTTTDPHYYELVKDEIVRCRSITKELIDKYNFKKLFDPTK